MKRYKKIFYLILVSTNLINSLAAQSYTLTGYVTDASTGEALINATVYEAQSYKGTTTNEYGFYSLTLSAGEVVLKAAYVGYQGYTRYLELSVDTTININLDLTTLDEVVVIASKEEERLLQENTQMSSVNLSMKQIQAVPTLLGEADILKALSLTPGVRTGVGGTTGLHVRGGSPDQNLILLDGTTVYNVAHLFGLVSVFNTDAIKNVELIKGGFPARYGGRLSSVLDISMKEGNTERVSGEAGIGLLSSRFTINGPINKRTSYLLSARGSYLSLLTIPSALLFRSGAADTYTNYTMYDLNAKINHKFDDKNRLYFSLYTGHDFFVGKDQTGGFTQLNLDWGNIASTLRYNRIFTPKLFGKFMINYAQYKYHFLESNEDVSYFYDYESTSKVQDISAKFNFDYLPNSAHYIKFGGEVTRHRYQPATYRFQDKSENGYEVQQTFTTLTNEFAAYLEDDFKLTQWWSLNAGIRYSAFYVENQWYSAPEPRITTKFLIGNWALKGSYSYMQQYIHLLSSNGIGLPNDIWVPATANVPPQRSEQIAAGLSRTFAKQYLDISIEGYHKKMNNLTDFSRGENQFTTLTDTWEAFTEQGGVGEAYGLEFFLHRKRGRLNGWFAYTLSWNNRQFDNINSGAVYPAKYDNRHDASIVANYELSPKLTISAVWNYQSGSPMTLPTATHLYVSDYGDLEEVENYPLRNNYRTDATHRLDLGLKLRTTTKKRKRNGIWHFGIYNAYNQVNPLYIEILWRTTRDESGNLVALDKVLKEIGYIPIIPSISYSLEF